MMGYLRDSARFILAAALAASGSGAVLVAAEESAAPPVGFYSVGGLKADVEPDHWEPVHGHVGYSPTGAEWELVFEGGLITENFSHSKNNMLRCLTYGAGTFVATGNPGVAIMYSHDGREWHHAVGPDDDIGGSFCVAYGNGRFVAARAQGFAVSTDGIEWERHKPDIGMGIWGDDGAGHVRQIIFGNGVFLCRGGKRMGVTENGVEYQHHRLLEEDERTRRQALLFGAGRFIWLHERGHRWSENGVDWQPFVIEGDDPELVRKQTGGGIWTGSEFIIQGPGCLYRSPDGIEWTRQEVESGSVDLRAGDAAGQHLLGRVWKKGFTRSADGGRTWSIVPAEHVGVRQVYYFDGERVIGVGSG